MTAGVIPDVAITADVITTAADAAITVAVADGELPHTFAVSYELI